MSAGGASWKLRAPFSFYAIVDDDGTGASAVLECEEDDNDAVISGVDCDILF